MCACLRTADSNAIERRNKNVNLLVLWCPLCPHTLHRVKVRSKQRTRHGKIRYQKELCILCKVKINNVYRLEAARNFHYSSLYSYKKSEPTPVFLAIGLFQSRPTFYNICLSVSHQLNSTGTLCKSTHAQRRM